VDDPAARAAGLLINPAGHTELEPLNLTDNEMAQLVAFLRGVNTSPEWLYAP